MADLVSTSATWPNYSTSNVKTAASTSKTELGKEQFLTILVAQLKNQDPLSPMDNSQFVAQMAQFSSLEQLMNINEKMDTVQTSMDTSLGGASQLIGKKITWLNESTDSTTGATSSTYETGTVDSIILKNKVLYAQVGENAIPLSLVTKVEPVSTSSTTTAETSTAATDTAATTTATDTTSTGTTTTDSTSSTSTGTTTGSTNTTSSGTTTDSTTGSTTTGNTTSSGTTTESTTTDTTSDSAAASDTSSTTSATDSSSSTDSTSTDSSTSETGTDSAASSNAETAS